MNTIDKEKHHKMIIGHGLIKIAAGENFYGTALYDALELAEITQHEKGALERHLYGSELQSDRFVLRYLGNRLLQDNSRILIKD
jgi:hypothetical protein